MRCLIPLLISMLIAASCSSSTTAESASESFEPSPAPPADNPTPVVGPATAPPLPAPATVVPSAEPTVASENEAFGSDTDSSAPAPVPVGTELDLVSALLADTANPIPHESRESDSGLNRHPGQNPADDCNGLLRGQAHDQLRFADVEFRWYELGLAIDQSVADYSDARSAIAHMEKFESLGDQCSSGMLYCSGCGLSDEGSFDRLHTITRWDTGTADVLAIQSVRAEDDLGEWRALYQRGSVVSSLHMTRDLSEPWPAREQDLLAFNQTAALMALALDQAAVRPAAGPWPEPYQLGAFSVEFRGLHSDDQETAWVDYHYSGDTARVYASFNTEGDVVDSLTILLMDDPHDPEDVDYTLGDYSYFDDETTVGGSQAIWMPWFDDDMERSKGNLLVWDASPETYGWMQSRTFTLDEMRAAAHELKITGTDFEWADPSAGMQLVANDLFAAEADDLLNRGGQVARYDIDWDDGDDSGYSDMTIGFYSLLEGEIDLIRSLAFAEERVEVRGTTGYQLQIEPVSKYEEGVLFLVWQEDEATVAIARVDDAKATHLLAQVADRFDRNRPYD